MTNFADKTSVSRSAISEHIKKTRRAEKSKAESDSSLENNYSSGGGGEVPEELELWRTSLVEMLHSMNPYAFERLAMLLLREGGFPQVRVTKKSGDGGIDGTGKLHGHHLYSMPSLFTWNQIGVLQIRQKMKEQEGTNKGQVREMAIFIETFDAENGELREKIDELNDQLLAVRAHRDAILAMGRGGNENGFFYKSGEEAELYPGEKVELLYNVLSQVIDKYPPDSRAHLLIDALLSANPKAGECDRIIRGLREIFGNGDRLTKAGKNRLKDLGFTVMEDGTHYKITFHDPRYMFTVSKTPGDHREGKNLISDICKAIDISWKI